MAKVYKAFDQNKIHYGYAFYCPGCKYSHVVWTKRPNEINGAKWTFNGDENSPTFRASLLNKSTRGDDNIPLVCHLFVTDGKIQYLNDCSHDLAGKTIEMEDIE